MTDARQPARLEISEAVSGMERLVWPPARENGPRISGQTKKRSGVAVSEICQGSTNGGGAQVCEFRGVVFQGESKAHSLARRGWGMGKYKGPRRVA